jgi:hypothetical protein
MTGHLVIFIGLNGKAAWVIVAEFFFLRTLVSELFFRCGPKFSAVFLPDRAHQPQDNTSRKQRLLPITRYDALVIAKL